MRGGWRTVASGLALASMLAAAASAHLAGGGYADDNDDTVGTLPALMGAGFGDELIPLDILPALQFEGAYPQVTQMILSATGDGYAVLEMVDREGTVRLSFHGDIAVAVDEAAFMALAPTTSLAAGPLSGGLRAVFAWDGAIMGPQGVPAQGVLDLPIEFLMETGMIAPGQATVHTLQRNASRRRLELEGAAGLLIFHQGN